MYVLICHTKVLPDKADLYEGTFAKLRKIVLAKEPGVLFYELTKHPEKPNLYVLVEAYTDEAAQEVHLSSDYYRAHNEIIVGCIDGGHEGYDFVVHRAIDYDAALAAVA